MSKSAKKFFRTPSFKKNSQKSKEKSQAQLQTVTFMLISDEQGGVSIPYQVWAEPIKSFIKEKGGTWCSVFKIWKMSRVQMQFVIRDLPNLLTANYQPPPKFIKNATLPMRDQLLIGSNSYKKETFNIESHLLYDKLYKFQRETLIFCQ